MRVIEVSTYRRPAAYAVICGLFGVALIGCAEADQETQDGCETFGVYAQNRFEPYGTAIREEPDVLSDKVGSFEPNEVIAVDGWYDSGEPIYPTNPEPWNSSVWLRIDYDNQEGWVSFPGVRAAPSSPDETGGFSEYGGEPVILPPDCQIWID